MDRNPKRARKKEARDLRVSAQQRAFRRRRLARIAAVVAATGVIAALVVYATAREEEPPRAAGEPTESPTPDASEAPCPLTERPESSPKTYNRAPDPAQVLADGVDYSAIVRTSCGRLEIDLLETEAPATVASFVFLAREGYFDGLTWHRVERNFVVQTGDPNGRNGVPPDGPGYELPDELAGTKARDYTFGTVAMANRGPDTGGSQWFVIVHDRDGEEPAGLDPLYTIFGRVAKRSFDVLEKIASQPVKGGTDTVEMSLPRVPVYINAIEIVER